jgi:nucleoside-diphosphate-sugar epimerase
MPAMPDPMKVAVTGGSGRVGRAVVKELTTRGHDVRNLDRRPSPDPLARFCYTEVTKRSDVARHLEQCDAVIHLAEITHQDAPFSPHEIYSRNTAACSAVMQSAADLKLKRAIYTSSVQAYGCWDRPVVAPLRLPFDETHPLQPQNVYAVSKAANEMYCRLVAQRDALSIAVFRIPWVLTEDNALNDETVRWITDTRDWPGDGFGTYVHATDVARAMADALERPLPGCEAYHLSAFEIKGREPLATRLQRVHPDWPQPPANWPPLRSPMLMDKLKRDFGFEPRWEFRSEYRKRFGKDLPV